ncbi:MAG: hypothetical protein WCE30_21780 [Mycobacterium sp.]
MDRAVTLWGVALAGIVSATGNLDDPIKAWEGVNWLRRQGNPQPLPIWWAAAAWPEQVEQLVLPPPLTDHAAPGTVAAHAAACLSAAGLMDADEATQWQRWSSPLAGFAADTAAGTVTHGVGEFLTTTAGDRLEDMAVKVGRLNAGVRVGQSPPEFSESYLLGVAEIAESLRFVSAGLGRAFTRIQEALGADDRRRDAAPSIGDVPAELRTSVNAEIHLGFVQAATRIKM